MKNAFKASAQIFGSPGSAPEDDTHIPFDVTMRQLSSYAARRLDATARVYRKDQDCQWVLPALAAFDVGIDGMREGKLKAALKGVHTSIFTSYLFGEPYPPVAASISPDPGKIAYEDARRAAGEHFSQTGIGSMMHLFVAGEANDPASAHIKPLTLLVAHFLSMGEKIQDMPYAMVTVDENGRGNLHIPPLMVAFFKNIPRFRQPASPNLRQPGLFAKAALH